MSNLLGLDPDDVQNLQNPTGDPDRFTVGEGVGQYPTALVSQHLAYQVDYVMSRLPERYRRHDTRVIGDIVCDWASTGQTTFSLSVTPVTEGTVWLYHNWPARLSYSNRTKGQAMAANAFTVNTSTGLVTLTTPLAQGDRVYADYGHAGFAGCLYLRRIALLFVQAEIIRELGGFSGREARAEELTRQAYGDLDRLRRGEAGIQFIDRLKLVDEYETRNDSGQIEFPIVGGFLS